jgi:hypothetical protein
MHGCLIGFRPREAAIKANAPVVQALPVRAVAPGAQVVVSIRAYSSAKGEDRSVTAAPQATVLAVRPVLETLRILVHESP